MRQRTLFPVVMAGGSGSRLWPLSRVLYPKQFLCLKGELTMLQTTICRLKGVECESPVVICNEQHRFIVAEQLRQLNRLTENIILEPAGRNTAPAIALAALAAKRHSPDADPLMLVLAADHVITDEEAFREAVRNAMPYAEAGKLVTFGIVPDSAQTGYGYIRRGDVCPATTDALAFAVAQFVEKPDQDTAAAYVASGDYYWNSGMFLFRAGSYLEELRRFRPDILSACEKAMSTVDPDLDFIRVDEEAFLACPEESVDYAVMEHTADAVVMPMDAGWSDVGSWSSLWEISAHTAEGNVHHGDVISHKTENSYVYAESGLVTTVGVKDLVVVQTKDAVLIADRNAVQDVKKVVEQIKADGRHEHHIHREVYRPWGKYDSIDAGERYQVKRITVKPGEGLSVQMHHHRAEHWVVVAGTAKVTIDDDIKLLGENESVYIPLGATHCLENPGKIPLDLIEVRSGSYLEEDDVVRFADRYGRV
ncbi:mannose-1-phosphate guanyltransferase [Citrobacter sp. Res13-Sevr-PEB04-36]|uniref:mannose-1-phosphate guanyltransferase n=1 Tax=Citrobacter sp. Res13-Sevr-PEB04-36 TaxID=2777960 RepID=UPI0018ACBB7C|nr:mannose-1-phosphate guanyltransferase [Citrobacter sp. Res13-Sevr-PEB04-36]